MYLVPRVEWAEVGCEEGRVEVEVWITSVPVTCSNYHTILETSLTFGNIYVVISK